MLKVEGITKEFGGLTALDSIDFEVDRKEILGLIGPNGAGKTTLFNVISGTLKADQGHVHFDGKRIDGLKPQVICKLGINRTFQIPTPFMSMNVFDNVLTAAIYGGRSRSPESKALTTLEMVGLEEKSEKLAMSLNVQERKLLDLARALATEPKLLLIDEIVAGLSQAEFQKIISSLSEWREQLGLTFILIEHVIKFIMKVSDRIIVLSQGAKIAEGTPEKIRANQKVKDAYLGKSTIGE